MGLGKTRGVKLVDINIILGVIDTCMTWLCLIVECSNKGNSTYFWSTCDCGACELRVGLGLSTSENPHVVGGQDANMTKDQNSFVVESESKNNLSMTREPPVMS